MDGVKGLEEKEALDISDFSMEMRKDYLTEIDGGFFFLCFFVEMICSIKI